jgi:hypothetical protein
MIGGQGCILHLQVSADCSTGCSSNPSGSTKQGHHASAKAAARTQFHTTRLVCNILVRRLNPKPWNRTLCTHNPLHTLMNFFLQILCGLGLRGPSKACWLSVRSKTRLAMVLLKLFSRSAGFSTRAGTTGQQGMDMGFAARVQRLDAACACGVHRPPVAACCGLAWQSCTLFWLV